MITFAIPILLNILISNAINKGERSQNAPGAKQVSLMVFSCAFVSEKHTQDGATKIKSKIRSLEPSPDIIAVVVNLISSSERRPEQAQTEPNWKQFIKVISGESYSMQEKFDLEYVRIFVFKNRQFKVSEFSLDAEQPAELAEKTANSKEETPITVLPLTITVNKFFKFKILGLNFAALGQKLTQISNALYNTIALHVRESKAHLIVLAGSFELPLVAQIEDDKFASENALASSDEEKKWKDVLMTPEEALSDFQEFLKSKNEDETKLDPESLFFLYFKPRDYLTHLFLDNENSDYFSESTFDFQPDFYQSTRQPDSHPSITGDALPTYHKRIVIGGRGSEPVPMFIREKEYSSTYTTTEKPSGSTDNHSAVSLFLKIDLSNFQRNPLIKEKLSQIKKLNLEIHLTEKTLKKVKSLFETFKSQFKDPKVCLTGLKACSKIDPESEELEYYTKTLQGQELQTFLETYDEESSTFVVEVEVKATWTETGEEKFFFKGKAVVRAEIKPNKILYRSLSTVKSLGENDEIEEELEGRMGDLNLEEEDELEKEMGGVLIDRTGRKMGEVMLGVEN